MQTLHHMYIILTQGRANLICGCVRALFAMASYKFEVTTFSHVSHPLLHCLCSIHNMPSMQLM